MVANQLGYTAPAFWSVMETKNGIGSRAIIADGGAGYMQDYPVERFYRDVRLFRINEGTSQLQQIVIENAMLAAAEGAA